MPQKPNRPSTPARPEPQRPSGKTPGRYDRPRSPKANARSPVKGDFHKDQRRADFDKLGSKKLRRPGGVAQALTLIDDSMERVSTLLTGYREEQRYAVAYCYALAQHFVDDERAWAAFCEEGFWHGYAGRPEAADPSDALRFVLLWAFGATGSAASKRASKLHIAVRPFFEEGVPATEIPNKVEEGGGFARLAAKHAKNPRGSPDDGSEKPEKKSASATPAPHKGQGSNSPQKGTGRGANTDDAATVVFHGTLKRAARNLRTFTTPCRVTLDMWIEAWSGNEAEVTIISATEVDDD